MDELLTRESFDPHIGKIFGVPNSRHALTLVRIETRPIAASEQKMGLRASFNLIFSGPPGDILAEGMHRLALEDGTTFELYVVPVQTPMRGRQDYQSSFN
jgi:hypothetical protein